MYISIITYVMIDNMNLQRLFMICGSTSAQYLSPLIYVLSLAAFELKGHSESTWLTKSKILALWLFMYIQKISVSSLEHWLECSLNQKYGSVFSKVSTPWLTFLKLFRRHQFLEMYGLHQEQSNLLEYSIHRSHLQIYQWWMSQMTLSRQGSLWCVSQLISKASNYPPHLPLAFLGA